MLIKIPKKKKLSIDFDMENYELLVQFASKQKISNSQVINFLIENLLSLSTEAKKQYAKSTTEQLGLLRQKYSGCQEFEANETERQIAILQNLLSFFSEQKDFDTETECEKNMKRIEMINSFVIFPTDWVVANLIEAKDCNYAGVVEVRNGKRYNMPHILFFSEKPIVELSKDEEEKILDTCAACYPPFSQIRTQQVEPVYDDNNIMINSDTWNSAPTIGIFAIGEYGKALSFPAGAMIIRN